MKKTQFLPSMELEDVQGGESVKKQISQESNFMVQEMLVRAMEGVKARAMGKKQGKGDRE